MTNILENYIDRGTLAEQLGRSRRTLERWEQLRYGPEPTRIGRTIFYRIDAVREWLLSQEAPRGRR
jgi:transcriptional regulator GlxA family with amidase domain